MEPVKLYSEEATRCYYCGKTLGNQRCAGNTPQGPKWFCRHEPDSGPLESCFSHWSMRQARKASWKQNATFVTELSGWSADDIAAASFAVRVARKHIRSSVLRSWLLSKRDSTARWRRVRRLAH